MHSSNLQSTEHEMTIDLTPSKRNTTPPSFLLIYEIIALLGQIPRRVSTGILAGLLFSANFCCSPAFASAGALDPSFNALGILPGTVNTSPGSSVFYAATAIAVQPDGKIVTAGGCYNNPQLMGIYGPCPPTPVVLIRYNQDGSLDTSFGGGGIVISGFGSSIYQVPFALGIQSNGFIVIAGTMNTGTQDAFALARYDTHGTLDPNFGVGGIVTTQVGSNNDQINSLAIQPDGKIVAAGYSCSYAGWSCSYSYALARYNTNGSLDTTFNPTGNVKGIVTTIITLPTSFRPFDDEIHSVVIQPNGKIVAAGKSWIRGYDTYFSSMARYNADGTLDTTFNPNGLVPTYAVGVEIAPGTILSRIGFNTMFKGVALQSDGKIVTAGFSDDSCVSQQNVFVLNRFNTNGSLDTTFGGNTFTLPNCMADHVPGFAVTPIGSWDDEATSIAIQSDGKIIAAGTSRNSNNTAYALAVARYNKDGILDSATFNPTGSVPGVVITNIGLNGAYLAVAVQPNGKILAAGDTENPAQTQYVFGIGRYLGDRVTYNSNGSTGGQAPTDGTAYPNGAAATVQGNSGGLVRPGYNFIGWNTASNGSGSLYSAGNTVPMGSADVTLYAQWAYSQADLSIGISTNSNFGRGRTGAVFSITVTNVGNLPSNGSLVTVTSGLPSGLTASGITGNGWSCVLVTLSCSRSGPLSVSATYPPITLTVNVGSNAPSHPTVNATLAGGGDVSTVNNVVNIIVSTVRNLTSILFLLLE
jgi:uncharacterized delta-60 repeat protein/uncharacterized repeat protein (TIGR02543 family)